MIKYVILGTLTLVLCWLMLVVYFEPYRLQRLIYYMNHPSPAWDAPAKFGD